MPQNIQRGKLVINSAYMSHQIGKLVLTDVAVDEPLPGQRDDVRDDGVAHHVWIFVLVHL